MTTVERLYEEFMALSEAEHEELIELLWANPVHPTAERQSAWIAEGERRMREVEAGAKTVPGEIVHERMWSKIRAARD